MDANAYLKKQGWKGAGHSLDKSGRGIKKPLLISHKTDQLGLGTKKAAHKTDDQWWMRAFDASLQSIGTDKPNTLKEIREKGINRGGLYGFFVKGEGLQGTISNTEESSAAVTPVETSASASSQSTPATSESESANDPTCESSSSEDSEPGSEQVESESENIAAAPAVVPTAGANEDDYTLKKRKRAEDGVETARKTRKRGIEKTEAAQKTQKEVKCDIMNIESRIEAEQDRAQLSHSVDTREAKAMKQVYKRIRIITETAMKEGKYGPILEEDADPRDKYKRGKAMREHKTELKLKLFAEALAEGKFPNPEGFRPDQVERFLASREVNHEQVNSESKRLDKLKGELKAARKRDTKLSKKERRLEKQEDEQLSRLRQAEKAGTKVRKVKPKPKAGIQKEAEEEDDASDGGAEQDAETESDFIRLGGAPTKGSKGGKYPSAAEKRVRKHTAQATDAGLSVDDYHIKLEVDKNKDRITAKLTNLSLDERKQCEERAAKKGQSLEHYILRRLQKKDSSAATTSSAQPLFSVDTTPDSSTISQVWQNKPLDTLTKEERNFRLSAKRQARHDRKVAQGLTASKDLKGSPDQKKTETQRIITAEVLQGLGLKQGATADEIAAARQTARRIMKEKTKAEREKEKRAWRYEEEGRDYDNAMEERMFRRKEKKAGRIAEKMSTMKNTGLSGSGGEPKC